MQKLTERTMALATLVIAAVLCVIAYQGMHRHTTPELPTPYQAIALMNGQLFFGRLETGENEYMVLRDVFYIQARQNPETKAVASVLIKRGGEAHNPDRMLINRQQVLLIEPVKADSQIAKLIAEQNNKPQ